MCHLSVKGAVAIDLSVSPTLLALPLTPDCKFQFSSSIFVLEALRKLHNPHVAPENWAALVSFCDACSVLGVNTTLGTCVAKGVTQ